MSIKKIAEKAGVSISTVSRILNRPDYKCSVPGLREKVWSIAMEMNYVPNEAARNLKKHGVSFEDAELVFYDSGRVEAYDGREDYGEDRWATIGLAYSAVLYVVYTVRHEETIRLISARKANADERKQYREANS